MGKEANDKAAMGKEYKEQETVETVAKKEGGQW
jgi:hypothetical protein